MGVILAFLLDVSVPLHHPQNFRTTIYFDPQKITQIGVPLPKDKVKKKNLSRTTLILKTRPKDEDNTGHNRDWSYVLHFVF